MSYGIIRLLVWLIGVVLLVFSHAFFATFYEANERLGGKYVGEAKASGRMALIFFACGVALITGAALP